MDQMTVVGLATDCGNILAKDLWAHRLVFKQKIYHIVLIFSNQQLLPFVFVSGSGWLLNRVILSVREPWRVKSSLKPRGRVISRPGDYISWGIYSTL